MNTHCTVENYKLKIKTKKMKHNPVGLFIFLLVEYFSAFSVFYPRSFEKWKWFGFLKRFQTHIFITLINPTGFSDLVQSSMTHLNHIRRDIDLKFGFSWEHHNNKMGISRYLNIVIQTHQFISIKLHSLNSSFHNFLPFHLFIF